MDKLVRYRVIVKKLLNEIAALINRRPQPGVDAQCVFDDEHDHYLLLKTGWASHDRICGATVHVRLRDDKIWIEEDWTESGIANELLRAGVPKEDIVLAFHPPEMRHLTEFAVA